MRVSSRLDYALRAVVALAQRAGEGLVPAGDLAASLGLPRRFVEQQLSALGTAGIVVSRRGNGGGVTLARQPHELTVLDVVRALDGQVLDVPKNTASATSELWAHAAGALEHVLASVTVADLAQRQSELDTAAGPMYFI